MNIHEGKGKPTLSAASLSIRLRSVSSVSPDGTVPAGINEGVMNKASQSICSSSFKSFRIFRRSCFSFLKFSILCRSSFSICKTVSPDLG